MAGVSESGAVLMEQPSFPPKVPRGIPFHLNASMRGDAPEKTPCGVLIKPGGTLNLSS